MQTTTWTPEGRQREITKVIPETPEEVALVRNAIKDALDSTAKSTMRPSKRAEMGITDTRRPGFTVDAHIGDGEYEGTQTRYLENGEEQITECVFTYNLRLGYNRSGRRDIYWMNVDDESYGLLPQLPTFEYPEPEPEELPEAPEEEAEPDAEAAPDIDAETAEIQAIEEDLQPTAEATDEQPTE